MKIYKLVQAYEIATPEDLYKDIGLVSDNRYIIVGKHGSHTAYYCSSSTQGERMVVNALSMAKVFMTRKEAEQNLKELMVKYRGILDWSIDLV